MVALKLTRGSWADKTLFFRADFSNLIFIAPIFDYWILSDSNRRTKIAKMIPHAQQFQLSPKVG